MSATQRFAAAAGLVAGICLLALVLSVSSVHDNILLAGGYRYPQLVGANIDPDMVQSLLCDCAARDCAGTRGLRTTCDG
mgnify:CR=1 FL=1|jgi:hypothetical protein